MTFAIKRFIFTVSALALLVSCEGEMTDPQNLDDNIVHVTGISLDMPTLSLKEGETATLTATVIPEDAADKTINWTSNNAAVATVDGGVVTAVTAGTSVIIATSHDGGKTAACSVTVSENQPPSVTVDADKISAISAVLNGKALLEEASGIVEYGFAYSTSAAGMVASPVLLNSDNVDSDSNYSFALSGLTPETTYYYRSYLYKGGNNYYGETKSFTTKSSSSLVTTLDATEIEATSATLNAELDLTDVGYSLMEYGFYWGTSESSQTTILEGGDIRGNVYNAFLTSLSHKTQYWYKAYVKFDDQSFFGEVKTFKTDVVPVESVSLDMTGYTFNTIGGTLLLTATVLPAEATDKSVEWASDNTDVATVNENGTVMAVGNGTATIIVTTKDQEKTATCAITVSQYVIGISLNKPSISLYEGEEETLAVNVSPDDAADKTLIWTSSDDAVATVDQSGKVTAVSKGSATIKAEAQDGSGQNATCTVTVNRPVSSIQLNKVSISIFNGESETLNATVSPSDASNSSVNWTSSNTSVAMVSNSGVVSGVSKGTATITVMANDGKGASATCEVEVKQPVTSISLNKTSLMLVVGRETTLAVTNILPEDANDKSYTWSSSDDAIASVNNSGKVTAKSKGTAIIMATSNDGSGVFASCQVVVYEFPQAVDMGIVLNGKNIKWASFNIGASSPEEYGLYYAWGEIEPKSDYSWSTYKWCNGSETTMTKYCTDSSYGTVDNKTKLDQEDDVAHVMLGGKWRMPTDEEWTALRTECTWTWTTQNGVNGRLVTASNGNNIFLPAAGTWNYTYFNNEGNGGYWSSSLSTEYPASAWYVFFLSFDVSRYNNNNRHNGFSVRPISE